MRRKLLIAALYCGLTMPALAGDSGTTRLRGTVHDALGNPFRDIMLVFEAARGNGSRARHWVAVGPDGSFSAELPADSVLLGVAPDCFDIARITTMQQALDLTLQSFGEASAHAFHLRSGAVSSLKSLGLASMGSPTSLGLLETTGGIRQVSRANPAAGVPALPSTSWTGSYSIGRYSFASRYWSGAPGSGFSSGGSTWNSGASLSYTRSFGAMNSQTWNTYSPVNPSLGSGLWSPSIFYGNRLAPSPFNSGLWNSYYSNSPTWSSSLNKFNYSNVSNLKFNGGYWNTYSYKNYWSTYEWNRRFGLPPKGIRVHADTGCARWSTPQRRAAK